MTLMLAVWLVQTQAVVLENDYVRVARDDAPCASAAVPGCRDRVIVALGDVALGSGTARRTLKRGDIAVFTGGESYQPPVGGAYFEVAFKPSHPPVESPRELIPPDKNALLHDGERFFVFEERLAVGDTRPRHSHSQRVVIQLNRTRLQQWPEGEPEIIRDIEPNRVAFNPPVIHTVKNVGDLPLRGIVIELKPERRRAPPTPDAAVEAFFAELDAQRWNHAVALLDLTDLDLYRRGIVANARRRPPRPPTIDDILRGEPDMPRAVAEYQLKRYQQHSGTPGDYLSYQFVGVRSFEQLDSLPIEEVAVRWLQAQHPAVRIREQMKEKGCPIPAELDSVLGMIKPTILGPLFPKADAAFVLFRRERFEGPRGYYALGPAIAELRLTEDGWRILPRHDLVQPANTATWLEGCP